MFYYFPDPLPDELMYHVLIRFSKHNAYKSLNEGLPEIFSTNIFSIGLIFPSYLDKMCSNFFYQKQYTPEYFINNHSIFPIYKPFLEKKRSENIVQCMRSKSSSSVLGLLGYNTSRGCKSTTVKFCPKCLIEDEKNFGESYIHRIHQVPGIAICHIHEVPLKSINPYINRDWIKAAKEYCKTGFEPSELIKGTKLFDELLNFTKDVECFFSKNCTKLNIDSINKKYKNILFHRGFVFSDGKINRQKLEIEISEYYSKVFLELLDSVVIMNQKGSWIRDFARDNFNKNIHFVRHLLIIRFLFGSAEDFFKYCNKAYKPFGNGPWPCLNPFADHFKEKVVVDCKISTERGISNPIGVFSCSCGYVYSRKGPDKHPSDKYKMFHKVKFGHIWETKFKENVMKGKHNMKEISQIMRCSVDTVVKYIKLFQLQNYIYTEAKEKVSKKKYSNGNRSELIEANKNDVLEYIKNNQPACRAEIRNDLPSQYNRLIRYENEWMQKVLPEPLTKKNNDLRKQATRTDWEKRDRDMYSKIREVVNEMKSDNKVFKISLCSIIKRINNFPLKRYMSKLPLTKSFLDSAIETTEMAQIRRINNAVLKLLEENLPLSQMDIIKTASIGKASLTKATINYLDSILGNKN
jgi:hypothetical protein